MEHKLVQLLVKRQVEWMETKLGKMKAATTEFPKAESKVELLALQRVQKRAD